MPPLNGIIETALYVSDVAKSAEFYKRLFGFKPMLESDRLVALDAGERSVLLLFLSGATNNDFPTDGGVIPGHGPGGRTHFAFGISAEDFDDWLRYLAKHQVPVESTVQWQGGARSIYFRDPDDNLVEFITPGFWSNY
jgi:catechol 2,3-dioxygenase-like lactoylglutathione lyase family enzyme